MKFFKNGNERNETTASEDENVDVGKTILTYLIKNDFTFISSILIKF